MSRFEIINMVTREVYETITNSDYIKGLDEANRRYRYLCETISNFNIDYSLHAVMNRDSLKYSYIDFARQFEQVRLNSNIRKGQDLMNLLHKYCKEEYNRITYDIADIDCFHDDRLIPETLKHLENIWSIKK